MRDYSLLARLEEAAEEDTRRGAREGRYDILIPHSVGCDGLRNRVRLGFECGAATATDTFAKEIVNEKAVNAASEEATF